MSERARSGTGKGDKVLAQIRVEVRSALIAKVHDRDAAFARGRAHRHNSRRPAIALDGGDIAYV
jgi:hypothetical protein